MKRISKIVLLLALLSTLPWMMAAISPTHGVIRLDAWGAVGDGVTDDAAILTAAIWSGGPLVVELGPKTYAIGSAITVPDNVTIRGVGRGSSTLLMKTGWTGSLLNLGQNCVVKDLLIKGNDDASTVAITPTSGKGDIRIENVTVRDFNIGSRDGSVVDGLTYQGVWFDSCVTYGFQSGFASTNLNFINCAATNCGTRGYEFQASPSGVTLIGCGSSGSSSGLNTGSASNVAVIGGNFADGITIPSTGRRGGFFGVVDGAGAINPAALDSKQMSFGAPVHDNAEPAAGTWLAGELIVNYAPGTTGTTPWAWLTSTGGTAGSGAVFQPLYRGGPTLTGSKTYDFGNLAAGASESTTVTVSGAVAGNKCIPALTTALADGFVITANVSASNTVKVTLANVGGSTTDHASGTLSVLVVQQ